MSLLAGVPAITLLQGTYDDALQRKHGTLASPRKPKNRPPMAHDTFRTISSVQYGTALVRADRHESDPEVKRAEEEENAEEIGALCVVVRSTGAQT